MNFFGSDKSGASLSEFKDPFSKDCVEKIYFWIQKDSWNHGKVSYSARVYFSNGSTKGEQSIIADNFVDLVKKTEDFIKSL